MTLCFAIKEEEVTRVRVKHVKAMKRKGEKLVMLTAYDYTSAKFAEAAGIPLLLVGDSLGMVVMGYESTIPVTLEDILYHTKIVSRASSHAMVIADMPFMTCKINSTEALRNAARCLQEGGAQAVKLEGGESIKSTVQHIVQAGIPVLGHIGFTPQSVHVFGGNVVQGKFKEEALKLVRDAKALEEAGAFAIVLELVPATLARLITCRLSVPTIGIGAGPSCDGQVQVWHDILGMYPDFVPKHTRKFANLSVAINDALDQYVAEVKEGTFPNDTESFSMDKALAEDLDKSLT